MINDRKKASALFAALFMDCALFLCALTLTGISAYAWIAAVAAIAAAGLAVYTIASTAAVYVRRYFEGQAQQAERLFMEVSGFAENSLEFFTRGNEQINENLRALSKDWADALNSLKASQNEYISEFAASQNDCIGQFAASQNDYIEQFAASQNRYIKNLAALQKDGILDLKNQQISMENSQKEQQSAMTDALKKQSALQMQNLQEQIVRLVQNLQEQAAQLGRQDILSMQNMQNQIAELGITLKHTYAEAMDRTQHALGSAMETWTGTLTEHLCSHNTSMNESMKEFYNHAVSRIMEAEKDGIRYLADVCSGNIQRLEKSCQEFQEHQKYASRLIDRLIVENKLAASEYAEQLAKLNEQERTFIGEAGRCNAELSAALQSGINAYRSMAEEMSVSQQAACRQYLAEFAKKSNADMQERHKQLTAQFGSLAERLNTAMGQTVSDCTSGIAQAVHDCTAKMDQTVNGYTFRIDQMFSGYTAKMDQTVSGYTAKMDQTVSGYTAKMDQTMNEYAFGISQTISGYTEKLDSSMERYTAELAARSEAAVGNIKKMTDEKLQEVYESMKQLTGQEESFVVQYRENVSSVKELVEALILCQDESFEQIRIRDEQNISSLHETFHQNQKEWYAKYEEISNQAVKQYVQSMEAYRDQFVAASAAALAEVEKDNVETIANAYKNISVISGLVGQMQKISLEHEEKLQDTCTVIAMGMSSSEKKQVKQFEDFNEQFSDNVLDLSDIVSDMSKKIRRQFDAYEEQIHHISDHIQEMTKEYHELFDRIIQNQQEMNAVTQDDIELLKQFMGK